MFFGFVLCIGLMLTLAIVQRHQDALALKCALKVLFIIIIIIIIIINVTLWLNDCLLCGGLSNTHFLGSFALFV